MMVKYRRHLRAQLTFNSGISPIGILIHEQQFSNCTVPLTNSFFVCIFLSFFLLQVVSEGDRISKEQFLQLMEELFAGDCITAHRIVVLFTFCSDVIVYTVKRLATDLFARFLDWAIEYIMTKVCAWVARHGGWVSHVFTI